MSDAAPKLLTERRGRVLVVTINRPETRNAIDIETAWAMSRALDELDGDPSLSAGVSRWSGP